MVKIIRLTAKIFVADFFCFAKVKNKRVEQYYRCKIALKKEFKTSYKKLFYHLFYIFNIAPHNF